MRAIARYLKWLLQPLLWFSLCGNALVITTGLSYSWTYYKYSFDPDFMQFTMCN